MVHPPDVHPHRRIFCNRTLNLRSIEAIGYDLDYTLVHYNVRAWEGRAYAHMQRRLADQGWPVSDLAFDPGLVMRGLVVDTRLGNLVKVNRFGYVKAAMHGVQRMPYDTMRSTYARTLVDLSDDRYAFVNTLFSLSEACLYTQLVARLDDGDLEAGLGYGGLYRRVRAALSRAHVEGELKAEVLQDPDQFVELDPEMPAALLDQKRAGKKLMVITNSDWGYARAMLDHAVTPFLPGAMTWRQLFDLTVVAARKPFFFSGRSPIFRLATETGLVEPVIGPPDGCGVYLGGHAALIEGCIGVQGDRILYVGDHVYTDVNVSKKLQRWRTALVVRELERELRSIEDAVGDQVRIRTLMQDKVRLEHDVNVARLALLRGGDPTPDEALQQRIARGQDRIEQIDRQLAPLLTADGQGFSRVWGSLLRSGNDKSHLTRQIERHADVYTSRVSNFGAYTPFVTFRSPRGSLPHDA